MVIANPGASFQQGALNALAGGQQMQQVRQQREEMARANALADLYRTQGQGIASGDAQALNALAQLDPMAALDVRRNMAAEQRANRGLEMQETRLGLDQEAAERQQESHGLGMQYDRARLEEMRAEGRRAAETHASNMSEIERQREAQEIDRAVGAASMAWGQGPEAFEAWKSQNAQLMQEAGIDPAGVTYEAFPNIAAGLIGAREALEDLEAGRSLNAGPSPQSPEGKLYADVQAGLVPESAVGQQGFRQASPEEAAAYGATGGQFGPDGRFYPINPPSGMSIEVGPDGQTRVTQGPGAGKSLTETQSKDNVYSTRMAGALTTLNTQLEDGTFMSDTLTSFGNRIPELDPTGLSRNFQGEDFQVAKQAGDEFLLALLRKDTGAAVTDSEQTTYGDVFLPRVGDKPPVLEAKRAARIRALEAVRAGMSPQQIAATGRALVNAARETGRVEQESRQPQQTGPVTADQIRTMDRRSLLGVNVNDLEGEALDAFMEAMR